METRALGSTGLVVSRLGLGLAALGRPGYINLGHAEDLARDYDPGAMADGAHAVLDAARAAGVLYVDTARSYGRAEEFLGRWLTTRGILPGEIVVGSKWGYEYTAGWRPDAATHEVKHHTPAQLARQIAESRERLGDHLALYQIHSATLESGVLENAAILRRLAALRAEGLVIGLTATGPAQATTIRRALAIAVDGRRLFQCVQATCNLLEPSASAALAEARAAGLGVIVKEPLANGRLTARNREPGFAPHRRALERIAARLGTTLDALALAAMLAEPWADVVLSGAATVGQLRSNLDACRLSLDETARADLRALAEPAEAYWDTRSRLAWN